MAGRVAVTGGSGKLGRAVVADLLEHGWQVHNLDQTPPPAPPQPPFPPDPHQPRAAFTRVDLTDYGQTAQALAAIDDRHHGLDPVVHLASIPPPALLPNAATSAN